MGTRKKLVVRNRNKLRDRTQYLTATTPLLLLCLLLGMFFLASRRLQGLIGRGQWASRPLRCTDLSTSALGAWLRPVVPLQLRLLGLLGRGRERADRGQAERPHPAAPVSRRHWSPRLVPAVQVRPYVRTGPARWRVLWAVLHRRRQKK